LFAPVVSAPLATWNIVGEVDAGGCGICAFLAVLIPDIPTPQKLDTSIKQYTTMAGEFTNLRDRSVRSQSSRRSSYSTSSSPRSNFLLSKLEKARSRALTPPHLCFLLARSSGKLATMTR
jgi:hypothetical protein